MVVFTDLDGTLLDRATYSYALAEPAIAHLRALKIPLVLVSSKTRAEMEALRARIGISDPYIVENGAAIIIPGARDLVLGGTSAAAREALHLAATASGVRVRGFGEMPLVEICERTGLKPAVANLAVQREYGEPFVVLDGDVRELTAALHLLGFQVTLGGRFFHVLGGCDKAQAVSALTAILEDTDTAGLGDAPNDIGFLRLMRQAVIIPSPHLAEMQAALPRAMLAPEGGPAGWNLAVLALLHRLHK
jgi:mannosyl-3-phosphoglycerate phosphatase